MAKGIVMSIIQEKGGVGKSIATMNIAYYLSRSNKVLVIDLDGQAADITYYMLGNVVQNPEKDIYTIIDILKDKVEISDAILPVQFNLDIIPANVDVAGLSQSCKISTFKSVIKKLKDTYDYILIDVTPSPTWAHLLALSSPGQLVLPIINADASSLKALVSLHDSVVEAHETTNPTVEYLGIIVNRYNSRTNIAKEIVSQAKVIAEQIGTSLFNTYIRQGVTLSEQTVSHTSIFEYAPKSTAAKDYENLGKEIVERIEAR
ncbi:ParA family protein [Frisingicoccus sp.]|uniref:ParA family protein n=1 Tax=Frisingicoccus sp. TaxID=1918627 RepID=UPI00399A0B04